MLVRTICKFSVKSNRYPFTKLSFLFLAYIKNRGPVRALPGIHGRIVGGDDAAPGEFKYQVSWQSRSGFNSCGGSVLNKDYVLTAAHCCAGVSSSYSIVAGEYNVDENDGTEQRVEIQKRIRHPDYDSSTVDNDVCVLHLADSLEFNDAVGPVTLDRTGGQTEPEDFIVTGWGTLSVSDINSHHSVWNFFCHSDFT